MSSDEDFSLVVEPSEETLDGIKALIQIEKEKYDQLLEEQTELSQSISEIQSSNQMFRDKAESLQKGLDQDRALNRDQTRQDQIVLDGLQQDEARLKEELDLILIQLHQEKVTEEALRAQEDVLSGAPERSLVFRGVTVKPEDGASFLLESTVEYPMEGGTALIVFEEKSVAQQILAQEKHKVELSPDFYINVKAREVSILMPSTVQMVAQVCPYRVLVSHLPQMDRGILEDKLNIHFSRRKNRGGEVDECTIRENGDAVITFVDDNIAKGLVQAEYHDVKLVEKTHRVRVSAFVNGNISDLKTRSVPCLRTVLLSGIPDISDQETLEDLLEIHFQKKSNDGGEIEAVLYCPEGQTRIALFSTPKEDSAE